MALLLTGAEEAGAAALGLAVGACAYAGLWPTSQLFGSTLVAGSEGSECALTFDDGPNERYTQEILEYLANYKVRATFFMLGDHVRRMPWLAREVLAAGHLVGNHTMSHPNLLYASPARVRRELAECSRLLEDTLGAPVRFFRPPHGGRRPDVLSAARERGMIPVLWNAAGYDWRQISPEEIYRNLRRRLDANRRAGRGSNLLLHDGAPGNAGASRSRTAAAVALLLHRFKREGVRFVTLESWAPETQSAGSGAPSFR